MCFNPRPRRGAGATIIAVLWRARKTCFNPRPRRGAGATFGLKYVVSIKWVSILARAEARALRGGGVYFRGFIEVSILARAEARALQLMTVLKGALLPVSILARAEARALHSGHTQTSSG